MNNIFYLKITSPTGLVFGGNIKSISSYNNAGLFDILKDHTNFITTISKQVEIVDENNKKQIFPLNKGILRVVGNIVDVYVGIGD